jgi:hypothetical protein
LGYTLVLSLRISSPRGKGTDIGIPCKVYVQLDKTTNIFKLVSLERKQLLLINTINNILVAIQFLCCSDCVVLLWQINNASQIFANLILDWRRKRKWSTAMKSYLNKQPLAAGVPGQAQVLCGQRLKCTHDGTSTVEIDEITFGKLLGW